MSVAAGVADRAAATPLAPGAGFRIASNTKTFTAAAILRLVEQGMLVLDTPIADLLAPETVDALRAGGYQPEAINARQVLQRTSGIYDCQKVGRSAPPASGTAGRGSHSTTIAPVPRHW